MRINYSLNKRININYIIILFILSYNLYLRFITLKIFDGGENFSEPAIEVFTINVDYLSDFIHVSTKSSDNNV